MSERVDTAALRDTPAHGRAMARLVKARGQVFDAFDGLDCGITHEAAVEYLRPILDRFGRGGVNIGAALAFAVVVVESDRAQRTAEEARKIREGT